ncbi:hypothetical protein LCGC14_0588030 [marine sediment metagenome]|uniref:Uncharacterized protein n=1 Tax=marine sediment metagenome TaxID=412755 RepID=A0A0F9REK0_9ZZZZ
MGERYAAVGTVTPVTSTPDSMLALNGVAAVRGRIYDLGFGSVGTPADNATQWRVARSTTAVAVGAAVTETPLDGAGPASQIIAISDVTTEPGYADVFIDIGLNQRASWRWVAAPEGEIIVPADATSAVGIEPTQTSGGVDANGYIHWLE